MESKFQELQARLAIIHDLNAANAVLQWDQQTLMPPGGAAARGRQLATIGRLAHEQQADPALGRLLDDLRSFEEQQPYESFAASLIRVARRDYEQAVRVPPAFMAEFLRHGAEAYDAWARARPADDFAMVQPYLETTLDLSRRMAAFFPERDHIADPLVAFADYGMTAATVRNLFSELREQLVPIVHAITAQEPADGSCLHQRFPLDKQWDFGIDVIKRFGYDFGRGRQDLSPHPFSVAFSIGDVRITTRMQEDRLEEALFSTMHESGHAMYEQGVAPELEGTPLANGTSAGVHESQSRLWENLVGRSRLFWEYWYPVLQNTFVEQLRDVPLDMFYRAINKVQPSLIRTDADEVTYNLHVMMRFDFEMDLLEGKLQVRDLPEAWRERLHHDLGVEPADDRDGVLQDVHWFDGYVGGMFQGYTLGNILSAQFFDAARQAHPSIPAEMRRGEFVTLHDWLRDNIYRYGRTFTAAELAERVTGGPLRVEPYIRYLREKYSALYALDA